MKTCLSSVATLRVDLDVKSYHITGWIVLPHVKDLKEIFRNYKI